MDAITGQRLTGMFARSFSSFRSNHAGEAAGAAGGKVEPGRDCHDGRCEKPQESGADAAASLRYRRSEGTSLLIKTRDGDTVELKIAVRQSAAAAASWSSDGQQGQLAVRDASSLRTRVSFEVDGSLDAEELEAIQGVVEQAGKLADQFFDSNVDGAFAAAMALKIDPSQLASVRLDLSLRESMTYTARGRLAAAPPPTPAPPAVPNETTADATPPTPTPGVPVPAPSAESKSAEKTPAAPTPSATKAPDVIRGFLTELMEKLSAPPAGGASLDLSLKLRIFQSVVTQVAETRPVESGEASTLPPLVPETLDALAAREDEPLKAVA